MIEINLAHVRFWPKADIPNTPLNIRFRNADIPNVSRSASSRNGVRCLEI